MILSTEWWVCIEYMTRGMSKESNQPLQRASTHEEERFSRTVKNKRSGFPLSFMNRIYFMFFIAVLSSTTADVRLMMDELSTRNGIIITACSDIRRQKGRKSLLCWISDLIHTSDAIRYSKPRSEASGEPASPSHRREAISKIRDLN
jgi:hypothetical protein